MASTSTGVAAPLTGRSLLQALNSDVNVQNALSLRDADTTVPVGETDVAFLRSAGNLDPRSMKPCDVVPLIAFASNPNKLLTELVKIQHGSAHDRRDLRDPAVLQKIMHDDVPAAFDLFLAFASVMVTARKYLTGHASSDGNGSSTR